MLIESQAGAAIYGPTELDVEQMLRALKPADGFVILEAALGRFIQTAADGDGAFVLEYRDGFTHYRARDRAPLESVISAFQSYLRRDGAWRTSFQWRAFMDDRSAPGSAPHRTAGGPWLFARRAVVTIAWGLLQLGILATLLFLGVVASAYIGLVIIPHFAGGSATLGPVIPGFGAGLMAAWFVNHGTPIWLQRARLRRFGSTARSVDALVSWVDRSTSYYPRLGLNRTIYTVHVRWEDPLSGTPHEYLRRYGFWGRSSKRFDQIFRQQAQVPVRYAPGDPSRFIIDVPFAPVMADLVVGSE
ncbi:MAG: hypothetical protein J2P28_17685 [Actinobacteria bacterium]|nr:hypothetical protein [Actinomycetota bacterium]